MLLSLFALALAQESEPEPVVEAAPPPPTLAFVVSGGISRGSYLAGQSYVYGEAVKQSWPAGEGAPPIVFAGASAGTVSAVVGSMDLQLNPRATWVPEDSLHFRLWVGIGLHDGRGSLDNFQDQEPDGLYSTKGVQRMVTGITRLATGESGWAGRIRVGAQTSRVDPLEDDNIGRRILEPFALDLVDFEPHWLSSDLQRKGHRGSPDALGDLARASGAFPQAFPPVELKCSVEPDDRGRYGFSYADAMSPREERDCVGSILLMDGGVFDNNPSGSPSSCPRRRPDPRWSWSTRTPIWP